MGTPFAVPFSNSSNFRCSQERVPSAMEHVMMASRKKKTTIDLRMIVPRGIVLHPAYHGGKFRVLSSGCRGPTTLHSHFLCIERGLFFFLFFARALQNGIDLVQHIKYRLFAAARWRRFSRRHQRGRVPASAMMAHGNCRTGELTRGAGEDQLLQVVAAAG